MRTHRRTLGAALAAALTLPVTPLSAAASSATHQHADVLSFDGLRDVGDAGLSRNDHGIATRIGMSGMEPGVYTLWWVVWNAPEHCETAHACVGSDLFDPHVEVAIGGGGGRVVGSDGRLHLAASLREGEELTGFPTEFGIPMADALADARHAQVHLVLRHHGEKIPELTDQMLQTYNGGCVYEGPIEGSEPAYGTSGPNTCRDLYFAVFPSESATR